MTQTNLTQEEVTDLSKLLEHLNSIKSLDLGEIAVNDSIGTHIGTIKLDYNQLGDNGIAGVYLFNYGEPELSEIETTTVVDEQLLDKTHNWRYGVRCFSCGISSLDAGSTPCKGSNL